MDDTEQVEHFEGEVISYNSKTGKYRIEYSDGQRLQSDLDDLLCWMLPIEDPAISLQIHSTTSIDSSTAHSSLSLATSTSSAPSKRSLSDCPSTSSSSSVVAINAKSSVSILQPSRRARRDTIAGEVAPICGCGCGRREFLQVQCDASFMKGMCPRSVTNECQNSWRILCAV